MMGGLDLGPRPRLEPEVQLLAWAGGLMGVQGQESWLLMDSLSF